LLGLLTAAVAVGSAALWLAGPITAASPYRRILPQVASDEGFGGTLIVQGPTPAPAATLLCEQENWPVKKLADIDAPFVDFVPINTTVAEIGARRRPFADPPGNLRTDDLERRTFRITGDLVLTQLKEDGDIHVVIADFATGQTMITEFIDTRCPGTERSLKKAEMLAARVAVEAACGPVTTSVRLLKGAITMTGVGFWDLVHPERGAAPNAVELHPVLSVESITCAEAER
jgi:hypothetical protein